MFRYLVLMILSITLFGFVSTAQENTVTLTIINLSDETICGLGIVPVSAVEISQDMLHIQTIPPNSEFNFFVDHDVYHILALQDCFISNGPSEITRWLHVDLSESTTLTYPEPSSTQVGEYSLTIKNESDQNICNVLIYPYGMNSEDFTLDMILSGVNTASQRDYSLEAGKYGVAVNNCSNINVQLWYVDINNQVTLTLTNDHIVANQSNQHGYRLMNERRYSEALIELEKALSVAETLDNRALESIILYRIGEVYLNQAQYDSALEYYLRSLEIDQEMNNTEQESYALSSVGAVYFYQGKYDLTLQYYLQALEIVEETGNLVLKGTLNNNIGELYSSTGEYSTALEFFNKALELNRATNDVEGEGSTLNNMGKAYTYLGNPSQALDFFNQSLILRDEANDGVGRGATLNNIGEVYRSQGLYGEALNVLNQSLEIRRMVGDIGGESATLNNIGAVYFSQGRYSEARKYFNDSLVIVSDLGDRTSESTIYNNIALIDLRENIYGDALANFTLALDITRDVGNRVMEGVILNNIGEVYRNQNKFGEALIYYTEALPILQETGNINVEAITQNNMGIVFTALGQYDLAVGNYNHAMSIHREVGNQVMVARGLINRATLYEIRQQPQDAIVDYMSATEVSEQIIKDSFVNTAISALSQQLDNTVPYQRLSVLLMQTNDLPLALNYAEQGRSILARTELSSNPIDFGANNDEQILEEERALRFDVQNKQVYLDYLRQNNDDLSEAEQELRVAQGEYDRHLEMMQLQGGYLAREISFQTATLEQIQSSISDDTTLIVYSIAAGYFADSDLPKSVVFLVTKDSLDAVILDITNAEIDDRIGAFSIGRGTGDVALSHLYNMVFAPIADKITTSKLIISPDKSLNYVPFAALYSDASGKRRYLIDDYSIRMIPSGTTLWLLSQRESPEPTSPGLVGSQNEAPNLNPLPNAFRETVNVGQVLGVTPVRDLTETQLRNQVAGSAVVYISAHAQFNPSAPLYSVIHLQSDGENDGRLEVREIYELDLSQGTELVILSGCETGSGGDGEDFGLMNRAFFAAGAQEVVVSLWVVDDSATADLLVAFMENREAYDDNAEALRQAMLAIREEHPEPHKWASFVINGMPFDAGNSQQNSSNDQLNIPRIPITSDNVIDLKQVEFFETQIDCLLCGGEIAFSSDGELLAYSVDTEVYVWDTVTRNWSAVEVVLEPNATITSITFSDEDRLLAIGMTGGQVQIINIIDVYNQEVLYTIDGDRYIHDIDFSSNNEFTIWLNGASEVRYFAQSTETVSRLVNEPMLDLNGVAISPDTTLIAISDGSRMTIGNAFLVSLETGEIDVLSHDNGVIANTFSPNGKFLATSSFDNRVRIWDLDTNQLTMSFAELPLFSFSLVYSPDGSLLAEGGGGSSVHLWDTETGQEFILGGSENRIRDVAFSPDGSVLAAIDQDGNILIWGIP